MAFDKKPLLWAGWIIVLALGLGYVFLGADLIPDVTGISGFIGFLDDALILVAMFVAMKKWKDITFGTKSKPGTGWLWGALFAVPIIAFVLIYLFLQLDLVPDAIPVAGYIDDIGAIIAGLWLTTKVTKWIKQTKK